MLADALPLTLPRLEMVSSINWAAKNVRPRDFWHLCFKFTMDLPYFRPLSRDMVPVLFQFCYDSMSH
jgi:hypothetical protein